MSANMSLILAASAMIGCGVYLVLERSLTRVLLGILLLLRRCWQLLAWQGGSDKTRAAGHRAQQL